MLSATATYPVFVEVAAQTYTISIISPTGTCLKLSLSLQFETEIRDAYHF
jgi:hypothetical protein